MARTKNKLDDISYNSSTQKTYEKISKEYNHVNNSEEISDMLSYYKKSQDYRIFNGGECKDDVNSSDATSNEINSDDNQLNRGENNNHESLIVVKEKSILFSNKELKRTKRKSYYGCVKGGYKDAVDILFRKHSLRNFENKAVGLVNCYDGASNFVHENGKTSVLSFNAQLFNRDILDNSSSTVSSNIFT